MPNNQQTEWKREECYFDCIQGELVIKHMLEHNIEGEILDIACGDGMLTQVLSNQPRVQSICGVDLSADVVKVAEARKYNCSVEFQASAFEEYQTERKFDAIIAVNVLEHVDDHILFLRKAKERLKPDGRLFIYVPNADSLHVLLAVEMGVIPDKHFLNKWQKEFVHHTIHYDLGLLEDHIRKAGLNIKDSGSIIFKPFSNPQLDYLLEAQQWDQRDEDGEPLRGWGTSREILYEGMYKLNQLPELKRFGSTLFAHCTL